MEILHGFTPLDVIKSFPRTHRALAAVAGVGIMMAGSHLSADTNQSIRQCTIETSGITVEPLRKYSRVFEEQIKKYRDKSGYVQLPEPDSHHAWLEENYPMLVDREERWDQAAAQCTETIDPYGKRNLGFPGMLLGLAISIGMSAEAVSPGLLRRMASVWRD